MSNHHRIIDTLLELIADARENIRTAVIGRIETVNQYTVDVRPVVSRVVRGETRDLPLLREAPLFTLQGGGSYSAPPVASGDYAVVIIMDRCFDRWWDGQDFRPPLEDRMHDLSDAIAIVGVNPLQAAIEIPSVFTEMGDRYHEGDREHVGDLTQEGDIDLTGAYTQEGDATITGSHTVDGEASVTGNQDAATYSVGQTPGVSGTFTSADSPAKSITVVNGIITVISS